MHTVLLFLHMIKKYNYFQGADRYFRELAKVFLELKQEGNRFPADNYQNILNSTFYVEDNKSSSYVESMGFKYEQLADEQIPIDHGFVRQPDFIYGSKAQKVKHIQKYRDMLRQFEKVSELKGFLAGAVENPEQFSKIMSNMTEFKALLSKLNDGDTNVVDNGSIDRLLKIGEIYDGVVEHYIKRTFDIHGVGLHNMYEIYNPLKNGNFDNILVNRDRFVKNGMPLEEADRLAEEYCRRTQELSKGPFKLYQLIDSTNEESQHAISNLHKCKDLKSVNFYTPSLAQLRFSVEDRLRKAGHLQSYLMAGGDLNEYSKLANTAFSSKLSEEPVRIRRSLNNFSVRGFCSKNEPEQNDAKQGGFTQYLKKLLHIDRKKEEEEEAKKTLESITKDASDIKIGFHKIKSTITLDNQQTSQTEEEKREEEQQEAEVEIKKDPEDILIEEANLRFDTSFFKEFALSDTKMMQVSIEE